MKNLLLLMMIAVTFAACNNGEKASSKGDLKDAQVYSSVNVDSFLVIAENYIGKEISICGTVDHVCKHGGKKVTLFSSCSSHGIKGIATEKIGIFEPDIEGSDICIIGIVIENKIDMAYVDAWEAKVKVSHGEQEHAEGKEGCSEHNPAMEQVAAHRKMVEESEKGYVPYYTIEVTDYHVCETEAVAEAKSACCSKAKDSTCSSKEKEKAGCAGENEHGLYQ